MEVVDHGVERQTAPSTNGGRALLPDPGVGREISALSEISPGPLSRAALIAMPNDVPEAWMQGISDLPVMPPHPAWTDDGWKVLQQDALRVLQDWAAQAHRLGWEALDLFGVHPTKPTVRMDCMGLVLLLKGRPLVAITDDSAAIKAVSGGSLTFRRRAVAEAERCLIWELQR